jgi:hypothetical protein
MHLKRSLLYFIWIFTISATLSSCNKGKPLQPKPVLKFTQPSPAVSQASQDSVINQVQYQIVFDDIADAEAGAPINVSLKAIDKEGKVISGINETVIVSISVFPNDGSEVFATGPNMGSFKNGEANFGHLSIEKPGQGYVLRASTSHIAGTSRPFDVTPLKPKEMTLILNGVKRKVKFKPPHTLIDTDGDEFPVYYEDQRQFSVFGKHYKIKIVSPTEVIVDQIPTPMSKGPPK